MTESSVASEPADFSVILVERAHAQRAARGRNVRRAIVAVLIIFLHLLAIGIFVYSSRIPQIERIRSTVPEAIVWFVFHPNVVKPRREQPPLPPQIVPEISLPLRMPAILSRPLPEAPQSGGLLGVGRSLACGASSYENLTDAERQRCQRHPWHFVKRPDGTIVLDTPKLTEPPPSAIDIIRHDQQTAPPCPILSNVPCLGKVLHGGSADSVPNPF